MNGRTNKPEIKQVQITGSIDEACIRYGLGKNTVRKIAEESCAVIRVGRRYLVNFIKVDAYMNSISGDA